MKEAVTKVIDTLTQEGFHGAFQKLLERYNERIVTGGDYVEGDLSFMCVLSIKVPIRKSLETYLMILVFLFLTLFAVFSPFFFIIGKQFDVVYVHYAIDPIWRVLASSDGMSSWTPLKPQHSNLDPNPLTN